MNQISLLAKKFEDSERPFSLGVDENLTYKEFSLRLSEDEDALKKVVAAPASIVISAQNKGASYSRFISSLMNGHTVLMAPPHQFVDPEFRSFLQRETDTDFFFWDDNGISSTTSHPQSRHALILELQRQGQPGFIVRTSGSSSAKYKFVLHDANKFILKYQSRGPHFQRTFAFSPADSIAGIETLLEVITHSLQLVVAGDRPNPQKVADLLATYEVDYFQTTPTFMNMMVITKSLDGPKLPKLRKIAYGSEPSSLVTLQAIQNSIPGIELMHTYGMSEIGIQITETNQLDASTFRMNPRYNPARIVLDQIQVQSLTPMLGYLNAANETAAANPADAWFATHDNVEEVNGYWKVLGRAGDLINIAGRKFFPSDLENIIMTMPGVGDVTVVPEKNDLLGQALTVKVVGTIQESELEFRKRFKKFCEEKIPFFMYPQRVEYTSETKLLSEDRSQGRFKKIRRS